MSNDKFDLKQEIDRYTARITRGIKSVKKREQVRAEYADHMYDAVLNSALNGTSEEEAFKMICEDLGNESKIYDIIAEIYNKNKIPFLIKLLTGIFAVAIAALSYFLIDSESYRAYFILILQIILGIALIVVLYFAIRVAICLNIRRKAYQKLKKYAEKRNFSLSKKRNIYTSMFKRRELPELVLETPERRYILYLWATMRKKKTLRFLDTGLYTYSANIGYMYLLTKRGQLLGTSWHMFLPKGMKYFPMFASDMVQLPRGIHLMPQIEWEQLESQSKENIRVIMLNPIPFGLVGVQNGIEIKLGDDSLFCGQRIWSASGMISYLEGVRISGKHDSAK